MKPRMQRIGGKCAHRHVRATCKEIYGELVARVVICVHCAAIRIAERAAGIS